jgi:hypothetical protein
MAEAKEAGWTWAVPPSEEEMAALEVEVARERSEQRDRPSRCDGESCSPGGLSCGGCGCDEDEVL